MAKKTEKIMMTLTPQLKEVIKIHCGELGITLSHYLNKVVKQDLSNKLNK
jgi:predicted DNA binding CopG/RHH family protein